MASDASSLAALDLALGKMTADPMAAFGSSLTTKYGITGATLTVRYPYLPPTPPRPPAPPHSPPSPPMALHAEDIQGEGDEQTWGQVSGMRVDEGCCMLDEG